MTNIHVCRNCAEKQCGNYVDLMVHFLFRKILPAPMATHGSYYKLSDILDFFFPHFIYKQRRDTLFRMRLIKSMAITWCCLEAEEHSDICITADEFPHWIFPKQLLVHVISMIFDSFKISVALLLRSGNKISLRTFSKSTDSKEIAFRLGDSWKTITCFRFSSDELGVSVDLYILELLMVI